MLMDLAVTAVFVYQLNRIDLHINVLYGIIFAGVPFECATML